MVYKVIVRDGSRKILYRDVSHSSYALDMAASMAREKVARRLGVSAASLVADAFEVGYGTRHAHIEGA